MSKYILAFVIALGLGTSIQAGEDEGKALYTSKGCMACHGADANTPTSPLYPKLAGQSKEYALAQMKDIKSGARANGQSAAMKAIVASINDADLEKLAAYLATLGKEKAKAEEKAK